MVGGLFQKLSFSDRVKIKFFPHIFYISSIEPSETLASLSKISWKNYVRIGQVVGYPILTFVILLFLICTSLKCVYPTVMWKMINIFAILFCTTVAANNLQIRGFKGEIWPKPKHQTKYNFYTIIRPSVFTFEATNHKCDILDQAIHRYTDLIQQIYVRGYADEADDKLVRQKLPQNKNYRGYLNSLRIKLTAPCAMIPKLDMDESYVLVHKYEAAVLQSDTIWGVLRGLESFSQMLVFDEYNRSLRLYEAQIYDEPRFSHRGLLIDTSRHFTSITTIYRILDGMAYNKLNVLHWHIVDDQSFPYESVTFPEMSAKGAYHTTMTYTQANVRSVIEYARVRGIRVMPEFDMPAHTRSWGLSHPSLLTRCSAIQDFLGPMDPTKQETYDFIQELFIEIVAVFPEKYIHLGDDEVDYKCWQNNENIAQFMKKNGIERYELLEELFIKLIVNQLTQLNASTVIWHDGLYKGVAVPLSTVVHVWSDNRQQLLPEFTLAGYKVLLSEGWYLDHFARSWKDFYIIDPHDFIGTPAQKKLVLGGEACMWGESVDDTNIVQAIFPRVSAVAERLWSYFNQPDEFDNVRRRFKEQACRMKFRGILIDNMLSLCI